MLTQVGAFGFLALEELGNEGSLNVGIQDVAAAFRWVRKNIAEFGGDPTRVTAFGLSAGGVIIATLLMAEDGTLDLFDRAVMQSGSAIPFLDQPKHIEGVANLILQRTNCTGVAKVACLRSLPSNILLDAAIEANAYMSTPFGTAFGPVLDGKFITRQHYESLALGLFRKVPIMLSTTRDEGMYFVGSKIQAGTHAPEDIIQHLIPYLTPEQKKQLHQLYPPDTNSMMYHNVSNVLGEYCFQCPAVRMARAYEAHGLPVTKIMFSHIIGIQHLSILGGIFKGISGALHGGDIPFWWQFKSVLDLGSFEGLEVGLANVMLSGLMDFGSCANPSNCTISGVESSIPWVRYPLGRTNLDVPVKTNVYTEPDDDFDEHCEFFQRAIDSNYDSGNMVGQFQPAANVSLLGRPVKLRDPKSGVLSWFTGWPFNQFF